MTDLSSDLTRVDDTRSGADNEAVLGREPSLKAMSAGRGGKYAAGRTVRFDHTVGPHELQNDDI
ncbi:hypothetical protein NEUTE2DRAFT_125616 [Neurospora tetrasperma FGSC 2509]|nr:hypothetical protein NEUTE2DRAFT_125616 [Neurospora tetrasperma FGSC 2509]